MWSQPFWREQTPGKRGPSRVIERAAATVSRAFTQTKMRDEGRSTSGSRSAVSPWGASPESETRRASERARTRTECPARASFSASKDPSAPAPTTPTVSAIRPPGLSLPLTNPDRLYSQSAMKRPLRAVIFDYGNTLVGVDPALHSKRTDYADVVAVPATERLG